jgi:hypothetical protein
MPKLPEPQLRKTKGRPCQFASFLLPKETQGSLIVARIRALRVFTGPSPGGPFAHAPNMWLLYEMIVALTAFDRVGRFIVTQERLP